MNSTAPSFASPPPLPSPAVESVSRCYARAVALVFPNVLFLIFVSLFLTPKLEKVWELAGEAVKRAQWLMDYSCLIPNHALLCIGVFGAALICVEQFMPRRRRLMTTILVITFNLAVVTSIVGIAISALLVPPYVGKEHKPPTETPNQPGEHRQLDRSTEKG